MQRATIVALALLLTASSALASAVNDENTALRGVTTHGAVAKGRILDVVEADDDDIPNNCTEEDKTSFGAVIVTTAIPMTNFLGVHEGLLEMWWALGLRWGIYALCCVVACIFMCACAKAGDEGEGTTACTMCIYGLLSMAFVAVWITEIVLVAEKDIQPANGCGYK